MSRKSLLSIIFFLQNKGKNDKKIQVLSYEIEKKITEECPFKPKINKTFFNHKIQGKFLDRVQKYIRHKNSRYDEVSRTKMKKLEEDYFKESEKRDSSNYKNLKRSASSISEGKFVNHEDLYKKQVEFLNEKKKRIKELEENIKIV